MRETDRDLVIEMVIVEVHAQGVLQESLVTRVVPRLNSSRLLGYASASYLRMLFHALVEISFSALVDSSLALLQTCIFYGYSMLNCNLL